MKDSRQKPSWFLREEIKARKRAIRKLNLVISKLCEVQFSSSLTAFEIDDITKAKLALVKCEEQVRKVTERLEQKRE